MLLLYLHSASDPVESTIKVSISIVTIQIQTAVFYTGCVMQNTYAGIWQWM